MDSRQYLVAENSALSSKQGVALQVLACVCFQLSKWAARSFLQDPSVIQTGVNGSLSFIQNWILHIVFFRGGCKKALLVGSRRKCQGILSFFYGLKGVKKEALTFSIWMYTKCLIASNLVAPRRNHQTSHPSHCAAGPKRFEDKNWLATSIFLTAKCQEIFFC